MLEQLFGSRTRLKLLRLFTGHTEQAFFVRELTRLTEEQINSIRRELQNLERMGLLTSQERDKRRYYTFNTKALLAPELRALIMKAQLLLQEDLTKAIQELGNIVYMAFTGIFTDENINTDIFLIGTVQKQKLEKLIQRFQSQFARELNYTVLTPQEYYYRKEVTDRFLYTILNAKKIVAIDKLQHTVSKPVQQS